MATIKTTPVIAASTAPAPEVTTVTEVITRLAAWLRRLPPPQERHGSGRADPRAADHVTDIRLAATVTGELPIGYCTDSVTGTNWEGRGVAPQVDCAADDAIDAALARLPVLKRR